MVYQVGGQNRLKGFFANNWLDPVNNRFFHTGSQHYSPWVGVLITGYDFPYITFLHYMQRQN